MNVEQIGISLPRHIIVRIDTERKDIPRSKFILRLIEEGYKLKKERMHHE